MVKRLFSLVVALAIAGAPVALEACHIACASTTVDATAAHDTHQAHHHHATADDRPCHEAAAVATHQLSPHVPPCGHDTGATVASVAAARTSDAALLSAATVPPIADGVFATASTFFPEHRPALTDRLEIHLASPLRL